MLKFLESMKMQDMRKALTATDGCGGWVKMLEMLNKTKVRKSTKTASARERPSNQLNILLPWGPDFKRKSDF